MIAISTSCVFCALPIATYTIYRHLTNYWQPVGESWGWSY